MACVLLLTWLSACVLGVTCRIIYEHQIVGGTLATPSWRNPWQLSLLQRFAGSRRFGHHCGAVLIAPRWALTSFHCVRNRYKSDLRIAAGLRDIMSPHAQLIRIESISHPMNHLIDPTSNDIALLRLLSAANTSRDDIGGIELAMDDELFVDEMCHVTGFGATNGYSPHASVKLRVGRFTPQGWRVCSNFYKMTNMLTCASGEEFGTSVCWGDSGGPLVCRRDTGTPVLLGIVSNASVNCDVAQPGLFVRVGAHRAWIQSLVNTTLTDTAIFIPPFGRFHKKIGKGNLLLRLIEIWLDRKPSTVQNISSTMASRTSIARNETSTARNATTTARNVTFIARNGPSTADTQLGKGITTNAPSTLLIKFRQVLLTRMLKRLPFCTHFLHAMLKKHKSKPKFWWRYHFLGRAKCASWMKWYFRYSVWSRWRQNIYMPSFRISQI